MVYTLQYIVNGKVIESFTYGNKALCEWRKKTLVHTHKAGTFKIVKQ